jgi:tRNA-dihydrouridine synthase
VLARLKARWPDRTILGSGDVFRAEDAVRMLRETGVDVVWIARGAIGNPWIFRDAARLLRGEEISPPGVREQREALAEFLAISAESSEPAAARRVRKFGIKCSRFHPRADEVKRAFVSAESLRDSLAVVERHYAVDAPGVWPAAEEGQPAVQARTSGFPSPGPLAGHWNPSGAGGQASVPDRTRE